MRDYLVTVELSQRDRQGNKVQRCMTLDVKASNSAVAASRAIKRAGFAHRFAVLRLEIAELRPAPLPIGRIVRLS